MNQQSANSWAAFETHSTDMVEAARRGDWDAAATVQVQRDAALADITVAPDGDTRRRLLDLDQALMALVSAARDAAGHELADSRRGQQATRAYSEQVSGR